MPIPFKPMADQQVILDQYTQGKAAVLAAPGSGKTTLISRLIAYWVNQLEVPTHHILVLTFTESAALEFETRTMQLLNPVRKPPVFSTIHGFSNRLLRQVNPNFSEREVLSDERKYHFLDQLLTEFQLMHPTVDYTRFLGDVLIPRYRMFPYEIEINGVQDLRQYLGFPSEHEKLLVKLPQLVADYEAILAKENFIDYDMMISETLKSLKANPQVLSQIQGRYPYIIEDEAQDSNPLQTAILEALAGENGNLLRVGDPNQSIYGFNGADYKELNAFAKRNMIFPMSQSNRASEQLMAFANHLHQSNSFAFPSSVQLEKGIKNPDKGWIWVKSYQSLSKEIENVLTACQSLLKQKKSVAILCRTNQNCRWLHQELELANIPALLHHDRHEHFFQSNMAIFLGHLFDYLLQPTQFHQLQQVMLSLYLTREEFLRYFKIDTPILETLKSLARQEIYHPKTEPVQYLRLCQIAKTLLELIDNIYYPISHLLEWVTEHLLYKIEDQAQARLLHQLWLQTHWQSNIKSLEMFREWLDKAGRFKIRQQLNAEDAEEGLTSKGHVHLLTVHKSKGLEWDGVLMPFFQYGNPFVSADKEFKTILQTLHQDRPYQTILDEVEEQEETEALRLVYVGITRAKRFLSITASQERCPEAGIYKTHESPYFGTLRQGYETLK